ncbi:MAG: YlmC/YmxH family sporulation protein [Clostridia bacterium]|nr:YlmC/YmxH family sporulation protein [Clostridia bacterium]
MICRIDELKNRQVVCISDGYVLGVVGDVELDTMSGRLISIVIFGNLRAFGLLGKEKDIIIPFEDIAVIGEETVLVKTNSFEYRRIENGKQ